MAVAALMAIWWATETIPLAVTALVPLVLFLAIAYGASVGGMSTLVGSPTNLICPRTLTLLYPGAPEITCTSWMTFALPICPL